MRSSSRDNPRYAYNGYRIVSESSEDNIMTSLSGHPFRRTATLFTLHANFIDPPDSSSLLYRVLHPPPRAVLHPSPFCARYNANPCICYRKRKKLALYSFPFIHFAIGFDRFIRFTITKTLEFEVKKKKKQFRNNFLPPRSPHNFSQANSFPSKIRNKIRNNIPIYSTSIRIRTREAK